MADFQTLFARLITACTTGNLEEAKKILHPLTRKCQSDFIAFDRYLIFHLAAANGHCNIVDFILKHVKSTTPLIPAEEAVITVLAERKWEGFKAALAHSHVHTLQAILQEEFLLYDGLDIIAQHPHYIASLWQLPLQPYLLILFTRFCSQSIRSTRKMFESIPYPGQKTLLEYPPAFEAACVADRWRC